MADIIIKGVKFLPINPKVDQKVTIRYRLASDPDVDASYTVIGTEVNVSTNGTINPNLVIHNVISGETYVIQGINNCNGVKSSNNVIVDNPVTYAWVEDLYVCEDDALITEVISASGFSSPIKLYFNDERNRIYGVDADDSAGNIFWFDPQFFTGSGSLTHSATVHHVIYDNDVDFDPVRKRIYLAGLNTGGLIAYSMETDTIVGTVAYGANTPFNRLLVKVIGDNIYCAHSINNLAIINANTLTLTSDRVNSAIPSGVSSLNNGYNIYEVGSNRWVTAAGGRTTKDIYVYNAAFTTLIATITLPSLPVPGWGASRYWGTGFYDSQNNKFYYHDIGSSQTYVIDGTSRSIIKTIPFANTEGKTYAQIDFSFDPNVGRLYFNYTAYVAPTDSTGSKKKRSYIFNRNTLELENLYPNLITSNLVPQAGSSLLWTANRGIAIWDSPNTNYNTDGVITKLTY